MKLRWGWMLAIAMVCLLWSLSADASPNPAASFDQHLVTCSADSCSPSSYSYSSLRVLREHWIRTRAGPQNISLSPDVSRRTEDLDPEGPPWLESHGPPGKYRAPGQPAGLWVAKVATEALQRGVNYAATAKFFGGRTPAITIEGFSTRFSYSYFPAQNAAL
jgi:hypothetical protein